MEHPDTNGNDPPTVSRIPSPYWAPVSSFLAERPEAILGRLARGSEGDIEATQLQAWRLEVEVLRSALSSLGGTLFLEFDVPRLGSRIDAVWVAGPAVFPIEFKCNEDEYKLAHRNQAWDYALDLKNFHRGSRDCPVLPILVATHARRSDDDWPAAHADGVHPPIRCNAETLGRLLHRGLSLISGPSLDAVAWGASSYEPTPTIIEAARALYARHSVEAISRHDAALSANMRETAAPLGNSVEGG